MLNIHQFFKGRDATLSEILEGKKLTGVEVEVNNTFVIPQATTNGVSVSGKTSKPNEKDSNTLVIRVEFGLNFNDSDKKFRSVVGGYAGLGSREKMEIFTQYEKCLQQHGLLEKTSNKKQKDNSSSSSPGFAF